MPTLKLSSARFWASLVRSNFITEPPWTFCSETKSEHSDSIGSFTLVPGEYIVRLQRSMRSRRGNGSAVCPTSNNDEIIENPPPLEWVRTSSAGFDGSWVQGIDWDFTPSFSAYWGSMGMGSARHLGLAWFFFGTLQRQRGSSVFRPRNLRKHQYFPWVHTSINVTLLSESKQHCICPVLTGGSCFPR